MRIPPIITALAFLSSCSTGGSQVIDPKELEELIGADLPENTTVFLAYESTQPEELGPELVYFMVNEHESLLDLCQQLSERFLLASFPGGCSGGNRMDSLRAHGHLIAQERLAVFKLYSG